MQVEVSSMVSEWITSALIKKIIERKAASTSVPELREKIGDYVADIDITENNQIEAIKQPQFWFVDSKTVDWETAKNDVFSSLNWGKLQIGEPTETEFIIEDLISETSVKEAADWVYRLFLDNTSNSLLLCTLIHALSHLDYEQSYPYGPMMAMTMLSHDDKRVVSYAIKAFSNWNSKDSLKYVKNFSPKQEWAKKEWDRVVNYINENGDEQNGVFDENDHTAKMDTRTA